MAQAPVSELEIEGDIDLPTEKSGEKPEKLALSLKATPEFSILPFNDEKQSFLLMTSVKAPYFREGNRAPIDLVCSIDESSSMSGDRIALVKETVEFIIKNLESRDRFGCVGYSTHAREILPLTKMDSDGKKLALDKIQAINARGCTALCDGLCLGLDMMRKRDPFDKNEVASLMLFTDGEANQGPRNAREIIEATLRPSKAKETMVDKSNNPKLSLTAPASPRKKSRTHQSNPNSSVAGAKLTSVSTHVQQLSTVEQQIEEQMKSLQLQLDTLRSGVSLPPSDLPLTSPLTETQKPMASASVEAGNTVSPSGSNAGATAVVDSNAAPAANEAAEEGKTEAGASTTESEGAPPTIQPKEDNGELPCTIYTFGFGEGHNEALLQALSEHGRGMYTFIEKTDEIADTFADCLGGLVSIVGQQLRLKISVLNGVRINRCLSVGFRITESKPNLEYLIEIADIQSEENRDLVFELVLPKLDTMSAHWSLAHISLEYCNVVNNKAKETLECIAAIDRTEITDIGERNYELDIQFNRLLGAKAMDDANKLAKNGDLTNARKALTDAQTVIKSSASREAPYSQRLLQDIETVSNGLQNRASYNSYGSKTMTMSSRVHYSQRSGSYRHSGMYTSSSKTGMMKRFSQQPE